MNNILDYYERHRPILHFSVKEGWMNDPNGLIYKDGWYHLFYQHNPDDIKHGPMHWGHARSKDLLHWEHMPIALYPDKNGEIFSGSIVEDRNNTTGYTKNGVSPMVAIFTSHQQIGNDVKESQSIAFSFDDGITFEKYKNNPVLDMNMRDFRDPKVIWHNESNQWIMPLVAGRKVMFYGSKNLTEWVYLSTFETENESPAGIWECPDLHSIQTEDGNFKWVLIVSVNTPDGSYFGMQYFVGDFDGRHFHVETPNDDIQMLDFGYDNYAAVTFNGIENRTVLLGWMNCWYYGDRIPASNFRGSMTIPRELKLRKIGNSYRIIQKPVRELYKAFEFFNNNSGTTEIDLPEGPALIKLQISDNNEIITLTNGENDFTIDVNALEHEITVDRRKCGHHEIGEHFTYPHSGKYFTNSTLKLTVLIDVTSVEIFAADGEATGTFQYFINKPFAKICASKDTTNMEVFQYKYIREINLL